MSFLSNIFRRSSDAIKDLAKERGFALLDNQPAELEKLKTLLQFSAERSGERNLNIRIAALSESGEIKTYAVLATATIRIARRQGRHASKESTNHFMIRILKPNGLTDIYSVRKKLPGFLEDFAGAIINKAVSSGGGKTVTGLMSPEFKSNFVAYASRQGAAPFSEGVQSVLVQNSKKYPFDGNSWNLNLSDGGLLLDFPPTTSTEKLALAINICRELADCL